MTLKVTFAEVFMFLFLLRTLLIKGSFLDQSSGHFSRLASPFCNVALMRETLLLLVTSGSASLDNVRDNLIHFASYREASALQGSVCDSLVNQSRLPMEG